MQKTATVDDVLADFEKKTGLEVGGIEEVTGITTGNLALDWQTGVEGGGLPVGRITELYGYESSGKTTTALQTAAALQQDILERRSDQRIIYLDFERALDADYVEALGIDIDHPSFTPVRPNTLEQGANVALKLIETGKVPLVVFDSVAAMAPQRLIDGDFDQATVQMHRAKLVSALCLSMIGQLKVHKTTAIFVNHKMESIEMTGRPGLPPKVTTPGGRGLKFYASLRLEFDVAGGIKGKLDNMLTGEDDASQLIGNRVFVKCVKNKVGKLGKVVELRNRYGCGFDNCWSALQVLLAHNLARKDGAWFKFTKAKTPQLVGDPDADMFRLHGEQAVLEYGDDNPMWKDSLITLARRVLNGSNASELLGQPDEETT